MRFIRSAIFASLKIGYIVYNIDRMAKKPGLIGGKVIVLFNIKEEKKKFKKLLVDSVRMEWPNLNYYYCTALHKINVI